ncbi:Uncharacterised protein [Afipia felis]|uniref:Methyltransferase FkbM domain-containing protein n=1 Tax=Afipia felis TaxID=1035 RepID=A0A381AZ92_AFIFE|nr:Uncharacterised protein [Afipia felis]
MTCPQRRLTAICARYAPPDIHFLKVDAEGAEALVFRGLDLARFRPWVIVGEISHDESWWPLLTESGYTFARADAANRYYIANERAAELLPAFAFAVDDYKRFHSKDVDDALLLRHKPLRWITKQVRAAISGSGEA